MTPLNRRGRRDAALQRGGVSSLAAPMAGSMAAPGPAMRVHIQQLALPAAAGSPAAYAQALGAALSGLLLQPSVPVRPGAPGPEETARQIAAAVRTQRRRRHV
jgi:hypothetical protein